MYLILTLLMKLLTINEVNGNLANYFCAPTYDSVDNLIKDLIATNLNHSVVEGIHDFCKRRNPSFQESDESLIPDRVTVTRNSSFWLTSFTHNSLPMIYEKKQSTQLDDNSQLTWFLYVLSRRPFDCPTCRISIYLSFNISIDLPAININVTYGFLKTMFPGFVDYTSPAVIWREDKSKFVTINSNLTINKESRETMDVDQSTSEVNIYFDNSFFGEFDQHFLVGFKIPDNFLNQTGSNETIASLFSLLKSQQYGLLFTRDGKSIPVDYDSFMMKPLITYTLCYSADNSSNTVNYKALSTCYPYVDDFVSHCICWETTKWKIYFLIVMITILSILPLVYLICHFYSKPKVNSIERYELPDAPVACGFVSSLKFRCGHLVGHRLPGSFNVDLKRSNGSSIGKFTIPSSTLWSTCCLLTNDVTDLIVFFKSVRPMDKPRYIEITFCRENSRLAPKLVYLYGLLIETTAFQQVYPYSHYLQHNRNVRLSDSNDWTRALTRINLTTSLPICLQKVQSLTIIERLFIGIYVFQYLAEKLIANLESYSNHYIAGIAEGLSASLFLYTWLLIIYICFFKRHDTDRYNLMTLSQNHQLFTLIGIILFVMIIIEIFNSFMVIEKSVWKNDSFNSTIASTYSSTVQRYDINWIIATLIAFIVSLIGSLIIEKIIFKLHKPIKPGPVSFDLGYDANDN